ncbi:MAG TPA: type II toxin-antitoxin system RelE/ParE family toxin [Paracoccaceae bacterium]|nr:type II toxin-antitoxin system RelE/ParE family toxin [Paracoccaceae bacterium]
MYRAAIHVPIQSTRGALIEQVLAGKPGKGFPANLFRVAARKVAMLQAAQKLDDLRAPPANRLEALKGDRVRQHSIRINDQWRICFNWTEAGPENVEIVDYH